MPGRELITLARTNKTSALRAKAEINVNIHALNNKFYQNAEVGRHYNLIHSKNITF